MGRQSVGTNQYLTLGCTGRSANAAAISFFLFAHASEPCRWAIAIDLSSAVASIAYNNLGNVLDDLEKYEEAIATIPGWVFLLSRQQSIMIAKILISYNELNPQNIPNLDIKIIVNLDCVAVCF